MRQVNVALDLYNIMVSLILISSQWANGKREESQNRFFILMCVFNIAMVLGDITNWTCEGVSRQWFPLALRFGTVLYYGCTAPLLLAFIGYVNACLQPEAKINKKVWNIACALTAAQLFISVLSLWTDIFYMITPNNFYQRGRGFWISQMIPIFIYGMTACLIIQHRKLLRHKNVVFLMCNMLLPLMAEIIQMLNYGLALLNIGSTMALLLIYINIQSERELLIQKQENMLNEIHIDMLMRQIYPHFLYNILAVIRQLCISDPELAREAVQDLSLFLRANMASLMNNAPIPFDQELAHVRHYLNLEQKRFGPRLRVIYDTDFRDFCIPSLTLQPIAENAVRHGIMRREAGGIVTIHTAEDAAACYITVTDDGPGFRLGQPGQDENGRHTGIGIENVRKRLGRLCGGRLDIVSDPENGTSVTITLPKSVAGKHT